jgi:hypothetical protein
MLWNTFGKPKYFNDILRDIVKVNKVLEHGNLLAFQSHNGTFCSLVQVPSSSNFDNFKRNARATGWLQEVLTVAGAGSLEENAQWTIQHLGDVYSDSYSFIAAACNLGVLLHSKKMDAESSCACSTPWTTHYFAPFRKILWSSINCTRTKNL